MTTYPATAFFNSVGVNTHLYGRAPSPYSNMALIESLLTSLGVTHIRDDLFLEPVINQNTYYYQNIRTLAGLGYKFSMVCFDPLNLIWFTRPDQVVAAFGWCVDPVTGNVGIEQFEGTNEPPLISAPERNPGVTQFYHNTLYAATRGAAATSKIPVLGPSYIPTLSVMNGVDLRESVPCQAVNMHPYPGCEQPETTSQSGGLLNNQAWANVAQPVHGVYAIQATEYGYHTSLSDPSSFFGVNDAAKARYLPRALVFAFINGIQRTYLYQLMDDIPPNPANKESSFGLADYSGNPKPSFNAVAGLLALTKPPNPPATGPAWTYSFSGSLTNVNSTILSRTDGSAIICAALNSVSWNHATSTLNAPVTQATNLTIGGAVPSSVVAHVFNDDGTQTSTPLTLSGGTYATQFSDQMTVIEILP